LDVSKNNIKSAPKAKKKLYRFLKILGKSLLVLFLLLFSIILFIRSPFGQKIIVNKATQYVSGKTNTKVEIEKLFITYDGNIEIDGLYLEDKEGDTLIYSKSLEANMPLWSIITGGSIGVNAVEWDGLRANIIRKDSLSGFNFQFLLDALVPEPSNPTATNASTSEPLDIILGDFNLKNIDVVYNDAVTGIDSRFKFDALQLNMEETNLEAMDFKVSKVELTNAKIQFFQKPVPLDPNAEEIPLPKLSIKELSLKNVFANYKSEADNISATLDIADLYTELPQINLEESVFEINSLNLKNSVIAIQTQTNDAIPVAGAEADSSFEWPELQVLAKDLNLENNSISYIVNNQKPKKDQFNPEALVFNNLNLTGSAALSKDKKGRLNLSALSFNEASGLNLKNAALNFNIDDKNLTITNLDAQLNNNVLTGSVDLKYNSIASFIEQPENTRIDLNLPEFKIDLNEVFKFQPELRKNPYLKTLSQKPLSGSVNANGLLSSINLQNTYVNWGNSTRISATGSVLNATNPDNLALNISNYSAKTIKSDLVKFVDEKELGISLPKSISLSGNLKGQLDDLSTNTKIITSQGVATINGNFKNSNTLAFDTKINIEKYQLSELLQNKTLGDLSLSIVAKGSGKSINTFDANVEAVVSSFGYNSYAVKDLKLTGNIKNGKGEVLSKYKDDNLNLNLNAAVVLDSVAPEAKIDLDLIGANLEGLGVANRDIRTRLKLNANFKGNAETYQFDANVDDAVVVYDNHTYLVGAIKADGFVKPDTTSVRFYNKLVDLDLQSNTDPQSFATALQNHLYSYFYRDAVVKDSIAKPVNLILKGHVAQSPLLNEVFLVNVKDLDTISIDIDFKQAERKLIANITAPHVNYSDIELDSLAFKMNTDKTGLNFDFGFKALRGGPIDIQRTLISGNQINNEMLLAIQAYNKEEKLINVNSIITGSRDELKFKVQPEGLTFNQEPWLIPETNEVIYTENRLEFTDFKISNGAQSVEITDDLKNIEKEHIALDFKNFNLGDFLSYFNTEKTLASGSVNGDFVLEEPFQNTGILADIEVSQLEILKANLGVLALTGRSLGGNSYAFNSTLKGGDINLDLVGDYMANTEGANLDLDLDIKEFKMIALEQFSQGYLKNTSGDFSGKFKLSGTTTNPNYEGQLNFNNANFNIAMFNAAFKFEDEGLSINNKGLKLNNFTVKDVDNNSLVLSGDIGTESFINPTFDLSISAKDFQFLDATKEDNDFLYGKASFDAEGQLTGDLQIPVLNANVTVGSNTDVTYVMPSASVNVENRDGVVVFVNRENPDAILTQTEEQTATIKGFDIKTFLKIGNKATVTIIIDEDTGDYFKVAGKGEFNFLMKPNGRMDLVGTYNVNTGLYEMNLYNLVNRKFEIAPDSKVTWSGDPFDAELDIRAIYNLKASASSLMAPQLSGADAAVRSKYKQVLPFYVYLNIDGELMSPKISFQLDMPEDEQGAIGGQVYGRVQQVNQQEDELNRQVFSLLVLNRFYPEPGSDGSTGGFATVARDNLNDAVSDQLNTFSNKILGESSFELDFGLDSYTDYQGNSPEDRTQLNVAAQKRLFNDRLIVRVGSEVDLQGSSSTGEETPLIGNVSLEYLLTKNGRYKLKGFRRNEFENVIDGQTVVSGIGIIFTQEFNKFSELWDAILKGETKEEKAERKRLEKEQDLKDNEMIDPNEEELNNE
jgi:translocation and assembly module TamB